MNGTYFYHPAWPVFYEDNHLLVLYKPAGLLVQADQTGEVSLLELAKAWLKQKYHKPGRVFLGLVHRLDRPVAGVMLFCRTSKAAARLSDQIRRGRVDKRYLAVVEGTLEEKSGRLVHTIERREGVSSRIVPRNTPKGQEARLSYRLLDSTETNSLLEVSLETGRHHQIRLQLAHIGHPIVGDLRYGASAPLPQKQIALLATELWVDHPITKERLAFQCPTPQGWPWPGDEPSTKVQPWDWKELREHISPTADRSNPCSFGETVEE